MKEMEEFEIGDEVIYLGLSGTKFVVMHVGNDGLLSGIGKDGIAFCDKAPMRWTKTGRKFPEAKALMDALSGDSDG